jgi:hypothetical protein
MAGYGDLPADVLKRVLGGMLLTHYRSAHPAGVASLQLLQRVPVHGPAETGEYDVETDIAIVDRSKGTVVAFYQVITLATPLADAITQLRLLREYLRIHAAEGIELGVAVPESREADSATLIAAAPGLRVMTYPA